MANELRPKEQVMLGYIRSKDLAQLHETRNFYFHSTDNQNNFVNFPYDLHNAKQLVIYSGGRTKGFHLTRFCGEIDCIAHKHKSKIKGKENSKTDFYFEITLKENFKEDESINLKSNVKKWMKEYSEHYNFTASDYLPILTFSENIFVKE